MLRCSVMPRIPRKRLILHSSPATARYGNVFAFIPPVCNVNDGGGEGWRKREEKLERARLVKTSNLPASQGRVGGEGKRFSLFPFLIFPRPNINHEQNARIVPSPASLWLVLHLLRRPEDR